MELTNQKLENIINVLLEISTKLPKIDSLRLLNITEDLTDYADFKLTNFEHKNEIAKYKELIGDISD